MKSDGTVAQSYVPTFTSGNLRSNVTQMSLLHIYVPTVTDIPIVVKQCVTIMEPKNCYTSGTLPDTTNHSAFANGKKKATFAWVMKHENLATKPAMLMT